MRLLIIWSVCSLVSFVRGQELLQNGGFESFDHWDCWSPVQCSLTGDKHSGDHALLVRNRISVINGAVEEYLPHPPQNTSQGPSQYISVTPGSTYQVSGYIKLQNDQGVGQDVKLEIDFQFTDNTHEYQTAASQSDARVSDRWLHLKGSFSVPSKHLNTTRIFYEGPQAGVNFIVDDASLRFSSSVSGTDGGNRTELSSVCDHLRKSSITIHVTTAADVNKTQVSLHVLQKKKSFPFGTAVAAWAYKDPSKQAYRDFIHQHFNWAAPEFDQMLSDVDPQTGQKHFELDQDVIKGLKNHGIKLRGHNLVTITEKMAPDRLHLLDDFELRNFALYHINETLESIKGMLDHWDIERQHPAQQAPNEQFVLPSYNLELLRTAHTVDPVIKLFFDGYNVVTSGASTSDLLQAQHLGHDNVGLYGLGAQCHFGNGEVPDTNALKRHLDSLAQTGLPILVTELEVGHADENRRADFYEQAITALYCHPAVEGILLSGFWDKAHPRGASAALVVGDNLQLTAAGHRVLDLLERRWMTDETHNLAAGTQFTVRGFHGDYEVHVIYQGHEVTSLKQSFTLGKAAHTVMLSLQV